MLKPQAIECEGGSYFVGQNVQIHKDANIGPDSYLWDNTRVFKGVSIGAGCVIGAGVTLENEVILGKMCKVQAGNTLYKGIIADDYVFFGPNATTTNDRNPRAFGPWQLAETYFGMGASIGANSTIIAGNSIGALSLVGAGAIVSRDVEPGTLVIGSPARFKGWVNVTGEVISRNDDSPKEILEMLRDPKKAIEEYIRMNNYEG